MFFSENLYFSFLKELQPSLSSKTLSLVTPNREKKKGFLKYGVGSFVMESGQGKLNKLWCNSYGMRCDGEGLDDGVDTGVGGASYL